MRWGADPSASAPGRKNKKIVEEDRPSPKGMACLLDIFGPKTALFVTKGILSVTALRRCVFLLTLNISAGFQEKLSVIIKFF